MSNEQTTATENEPKIFYRADFLLGGRRRHSIIVFEGSGDPEKGRAKAIERLDRDYPGQYLLFGNVRGFSETEVFYDNVTGKLGIFECLYEDDRIAYAKHVTSRAASRPRGLEKLKLRGIEQEAAGRLVEAGEGFSEKIEGQSVHSMGGQTPRRERKQTQPS